MTTKPSQSRKTKIKSDLNWQQTPEWRQKVKIISSLKEKGLSEEQIQSLTNHPIMEVKRIYEDQLIAKERAKKNYAAKIPMMKDIVGMGLEVITEVLRQLMNPSERKKAIGNVTDLQKLTNIISDVNTLLRLEEGKSTENISMNSRSYQETRVVLQELKKIDPVFDYPELPAPKIDNSEISHEN